MPPDMPFTTGRQYLARSLYFLRLSGYCLLLFTGRKKIANPLFVIAGLTRNPLKSPPVLKIQAGFLFLIFGAM